MYGIINRSMQELVVHHHGADAWARICARARVPPAPFVDMNAYDDDITYRLVAAAAEETSTPADELLRGFGRWWFERTAQQAYGSMMHMLGDSVPTFLAGLDAMHARIQMTMPELRPPSLTVSAVEDDRLHLTYVSRRPGLVPLLLGILEALGDYLGTPLVSEVLEAHHGERHEVLLLVRWA